MPQIINDGGDSNLVIFNSSAPTTVTLDWTSPTNLSRVFQNIGSANITLMASSPPGYSGPLYTINGASSLIVSPGGRYTVTYVNGQWTAYVSSTSIPVEPESFTPVPNEWLMGYDATTGAFSGSQPAFSNVSGNLASGQLPTTGLSTTVALAKLTSGGSSGSLTVVNGQITAYVAPS